MKGHFYGLTPSTSLDLTNRMNNENDGLFYGLTLSNKPYENITRIKLKMTYNDLRVVMLTLCCSGTLNAATFPPDGIYVTTNKTSAYSIQVTNLDGNVINAKLVRFEAFTQTRREVHCVTNGDCFVQLTGKLRNSDWEKQELVVIAGGRPYVELRKSDVKGVPPERFATITIRTATRHEANNIADSLRRQANEK
jgi:hypothetical protein